MNADWTSGYRAEIGYTHGYYHELNPLSMRLALLNAGYAAPPIKTACELGFGQGVGLVLNAAAGTSQWWGTDFSPTQAMFAKSLASAIKNPPHIFDDAFAEFCNRSDLPEFDFIALHGIWSWISDENRRVIVDFARRKLAVGGVLYVSYNTLPGWAAFTPMQELFTEHSRTMTAAGAGTIAQVSGAVEFSQKLLALDPVYAKANPQIKSRLDKLSTQDKHYLAHEYFNRNWNPMSYSSMRSWLEPAKLTFAGSAYLMDYIPAIHLTADQQKFLADIPDTDFRELVRDMLINQQFRRDYWVKGPQTLSPTEKGKVLSDMRVVLAARAEDVTLKVQGVLGEAELRRDTYKPLLALLANGKVHSVGKIFAEMAKHGANATAVLQCLTVLAGKGNLFLAQDDDEIQKVRERTKTINRRICEMSCVSQKIQYLASPVTGGGIIVPRFQQMMLLARQSGAKTADDIARFVWKLLAEQNQAIVVEGKALTTVEDNLAHIQNLVQVWENENLPVQRVLGIAD